MTGLVYTSAEATGSWSPSPLIVSRDSFSLWTWARVQTARSTAYFNGCHYIFDILVYYYICLCTTFLWPLRFGCWSSVSMRRIIYEGHPKNNESCRISREPWYEAYWNFTCLWYRSIHTFNTKMNAIAWRHTVWRNSDWRQILDSVRGSKV